MNSSYVEIDSPNHHTFAEFFSQALNDKLNPRW